MLKHNGQSTHCLNCGEKLRGNFCSQCGQENVHLAIPFKHLLHEFFHDYFHFDSRFRASISLLLTRPGFLTKEYIEGKRSRYIPPLRMYIFISILFFLIPTKETPIKFTTQEKQTQTGTNFSWSADEERLPYNRDSVSAILEPLKKDNSGIANFFIDKFSIALREPEKTTEQFYHNMPKMMFLLMPLFALLLKLLYIRSQKYYVEHLIFSLHFHTIVFVLLTVLLLFDLLPFAPIHTYIIPVMKFSVTIGVLWYLYKAMKYVYAQPRGKTITKMLLLCCGDFVLLGVAFVITVLATVALM